MKRDVKTWSSYANSVCLPAAVCAVMAVAAPFAQASEYLFQWDDRTDTLWADTYKDGVLIQHVGFPEVYDASYGLWDGVLLAPVDIRVNIYEADGSISDTMGISGSTGDGVLGFAFHSDVEGQPVVPYTNPTMVLKETGFAQTVGDFRVSTGDHYTWQFISDVEAVPEPETYALMLGGLAVIGAMVRRRRG